MYRSFPNRNCKLLLLVAGLELLTPPFGVAGHIFRNYTTADGLPDSRVSPIIQDRKGYMWFGTQAGLARYDGQQFVNFSAAKDIPGIFGRDIIEDHVGGIWFAYSGFARGGVLRLQDGRVQDFSSVLHAGEAQAVAEDDRGRIWVGSHTTLTRISFLDSARTEWTEEHLTGFSAIALHSSPNGTMWIATAEGTIVACTNGIFSTIASGLPRNVRTQAVYQDRAGGMWFGGIFGILKINGKVQRRYSSADGIPERGVWSFCEDNDGNFWIGTADGLYRKKDINGRVFFTKEESFGDAIIYDMCLDAEGNLWFASDPGIRRLLASDILLDFPRSVDLTVAGFGPISQIPSGAMLFGSRNNGLFVLEGNSLHLGTIGPRTTLTILAIHPESNNTIWYGIKGGGAFVQDGQVTTKHHSESDIAYRSVHTFSKAPAGGMLIGTSHGLWRSDQFSLTPILHDELDTLTIFDMEQVGIGTMWVGTDKGVRILHMEEGRVLSVVTPDFLPIRERIVYAVLIDHEKTVWFGTDGGGLVSYDGHVFRQYTTDDGLVGNRVFALAEDSLHSLWIGTSSGLSQFDRTSFRSFTYDEGFREIGLHGLFVDSDGMLWVSNFPGITKLKPRMVPRSNRPPPVYITDMEVGKSHFDGTEAVELDPNPAVITFRYAGLSFTDERNVRYRYRLHGFDMDWSPPVTSREIRYTHLSSGSYVFEVLARSADGIWSEHAARISFSILPPLHARWWFIASVLLILLAGVYALYRYRLEKALELERTRSRIAMDLHDDIGSSLTRISVLSEVAQRQGNANSTLGRIGDTARELIDALGDIVWSVDPKNDDLQNVIRRIAQFGQDLCTGSGITFETEIRSTFDQTKLSLDQRRHIYLLFKEALNNVVRHANASNVRFSVRQEQGSALLSLLDDGVGIGNSNRHGTGNGLSTMNERAKKAGGVLTIGDDNNKGTITTLLLKTA